MIKVKSNLDGKIVSIKSKAFYLNHLLNKRVFKLIKKEEVLFFIENFYNFINNYSLKKKLFNFHINILNESFYSKIKILKKNKYIYLFFYKNHNNIANIKKSNFLSKILFITRFKFLIGSISPFIFSSFWAFNTYGNISYINFLLIFTALILLHISANTFNDYFDWISGRDEKNLDYVFNSSGGSRSIDLNLITPKMMLTISYILTFLVILIGIYLTINISLNIFLIGLIGFLCLYFYSAPPIHLASRYGAGELAHVICLGPLITYGTVLSLSSNANLNDFLIGLPFGLLITCCLITNEYPDSVSDKNMGKNNLSVILKEKIYILIAAIFCLIFLLSFLFFCRVNNVYYIIMLLIPFFLFSLKDIKNIKKNTKKACEKCINIYFMYSFTLIFTTIIIKFI